MNSREKNSSFSGPEEEIDLIPEVNQPFEVISSDDESEVILYDEVEVISSDDEAEVISSDDEASLEELLKSSKPTKIIEKKSTVVSPKLRLTVQPVRINQDLINQQKTEFSIDESYTIASFDIGIKNLAYCILSYHPELPKGSQFKIYDWQVIDLLSEDTKKKYCHRCHLTGNYYQSQENQQIFYCLRHAKMVDPGLKEGLDPTVLKKHRRVDNTDNLEINIEVIRALDSFPMLKQCREVIMEQQPHKNARMKNLSFMIFSYFACRGRVDTVNPILRSIKFISSKHKLNVYDGPDIECKLKTRYGRNKFYGKAYCRYMIRHDPERLKLFESHKKQDDLADSYLQGAWYLKHKFDPKSKKTTKKTRTKKTV